MTESPLPYSEFDSSEEPLELFVDRLLENSSAHGLRVTDLASLKIYSREDLMQWVKEELHWQEDFTYQAFLELLKKLPPPYDTPEINQYFPAQNLSDWGMTPEEISRAQQTRANRPFSPKEERELRNSAVKRVFEPNTSSLLEQQIFSDFIWQKFARQVIFYIRNKLIFGNKSEEESTINNFPFTREQLLNPDHERLLFEALYSQIPRLVMSTLFPEITDSQEKFVFSVSIPKILPNSQTKETNTMAEVPFRVQYTEKRLPVTDAADNSLLSTKVLSNRQILRAYLAEIIIQQQTYLANKINELFIKKSTEKERQLRLEMEQLNQPIKVHFFWLLCNELQRANTLYLTQLVRDFPDDTTLTGSELDEPEEDDEMAEDGFFIDYDDPQEDYLSLLHPQRHGHHLSYEEAKSREPIQKSYFKVQLRKDKEKKHGDIQESQLIFSFYVQDRIERTDMAGQPFVKIHQEFFKVAMRLKLPKNNKKTPTSPGGEGPTFEFCQIIDQEPENSSLRQWYDAKQISPYFKPYKQLLGLFEVVRCISLDQLIVGDIYQMNLASWFQKQLLTTQSIKDFLEILAGAPAFGFPNVDIDCSEIGFSFKDT